MIKTDVCPVCGTAASLSDPAETICPACGFAYAFVRTFAGPDARALWQAQVQEKIQALTGRLVQVCARESVFGFSGGILSFAVPGNGPLYLADHRSVQAQAAGAYRYSAAENPLRNGVILYRNGRVKAQGDNQHGQCDTERLKDIRMVSATSECTYAVTAKGRVQCCGQSVSPNSDEIAAWTDVKSLAVGAYHLVGLTGAGRVRVAGDMLNKAVVREIAGWRGIQAVACAGDATIALRGDGTVCFAGRPGDPRAEARNWTDIAAVAMESVYAVGLTRDGRVLLAGKSVNKDLDMGRAAAAGWTGVIAVACSRSGIAALGADGRVRLAGNIREKQRLTAVWDSFAEQARGLLLSAAEKMAPL